MKRKKSVRLFLAAAVLCTLAACGTNESKQEEVSETASTATEAKKVFPAFEGKDLDGNAVDSSLISEHAVTVMNFWFTTCNPCVEELPVLESISQELAEKGGVLVGVNAFTQDSDAQAIEDAKAVLTKKGVTYQNLCFGSDSEAGKFTAKLSVFPTTYILDREGNIVGDPIIGALNSEKQKEKLNQLIEEALERDS